MYVSASDAKTTIIEMSASMCGSRFLVTKCYTLITIGFRQTFPKIDLYPTIITVSMKIVVMSGSCFTFGASDTCPILVTYPCGKPYAPVEIEMHI